MVIKTPFNSLVVIIRSRTIVSMSMAVNSRNTYARVPSIRKFNEECVKNIIKYAAG